MNKLLLTILVIFLTNITIFNQSNRETTSLLDFVETIKIKIPKEDSQGFIKPSLKDKANFNLIVKNILNNKQANNTQLLKLVNYDSFTIKDRKDGKVYFVLQEKTNNFRGLGTYIFDLNYKKNIVLEVPHPLFDSETPEEAVKIMKGIGGRAIFIAGTHRCANREASICSGKTTACDDGESRSFRVSDAGHNINNFFQEAHSATLSITKKPIVISLHGNNDEDVPDIILSDGTENKRNGNYIINKLRRELGDYAGSCNLKTDKNYNLCGTTNVQGALSNGSKDACQTKPKVGSGLFIHVEQHINIRRNPSQLIDAINKIL